MTTTAINWAWGTQKTISFNAATDTLDFGWMGGSNFTIAESNGSVVISIPSNNQSYTLTGVTLSQLSLNNIVAKDGSAVAAWTQAFSGSGGGSGTGGTGSGTGTGTDTGAGTGAGTWGTGGSGTGSAAAWTADHVYVAGDKASIGNSVYQANWWTRGDDPATHNGVSGSGQVWTLVGASGTGTGGTGAGGTGSGGSGTGGTGTGSTGGTGGTGTGGTGTGGTGGTNTAYAPAWTADHVYVGGDKASVGNEVFQANWWTQGTNPESDHGAVGTAHVWSFIGYMDATPVVPQTPGQLHALSTTETTTLLTWDAAAVNGVGTISGYAVYENGQLIGTTNSTHYKVGGLTAGTTYSFSVAAIDEAGTSPRATPVAVTTHPLGSDAASDQYFSPYVDMSLTTSQNLVQMVGDAGLSAVTLAFVLASGSGHIGWGGIGTIANDALSNGTTMASMVEQLQNKGVDVTVSFGGANGQEPALAFSNVQSLTEAYESVIDKYHVSKLDFDIEGGALANHAANHLRDQALVALEQAHPDLHVSFTLPVLPTGLTQDGLDLLSQAKADGVHVGVVNIMAMDYGAYFDSGDMGQDAISAAEATVAQLHALGVDAKVGVTPMIGINDVQSEVFTLGDAQQLVDYANGNQNIASIAMWSLGRDNGHTVGAVSALGSGVEQQDYAFSKIFAHV